VAPEAPWTVEYVGRGFERFLRSLPEYERSVALAAIDHVLTRLGIEVCSGEWGRPLGDGLFEFRIRRSLSSILREHAPVPTDGGVCSKTVLLRVFCTFRGRRIVVVFHGYDKGHDPSPARQRREIRKARALLDEWKRHRDG
jgi:putative component of toxin-antitoxin plasmid stabilization module